MKASAAPLRQAALLAFVAMCAQDLMATVMVVFEAQGGSSASIGHVITDGIIAGFFDVGGWVAGLICAALAIESIITEGWRTRRSLTIIGAVSLANLFGTLLGVVIAFLITSHH